MKILFRILSCHAKVGSFGSRGKWNLVLSSCALLLISGVLAATAYADTVVVSNTGFGGALDTFPVTVEFTSWTQSGSFSNVSVLAQLDGAFPYDDAFSGQAFLTTQIGTGTTVADQVATTPFAIAAGASGPVTLFTGLNLGPDTYYLIIEDLSGDGGWDITPGPPVTASGVTTISNHCELFGSASYAPADPSTICGGNLLAFQVVSVSAVPEPNPFGLCLFGTLGIAALLRGRWLHS